MSDNNFQDENIENVESSMSDDLEQENVQEVDDELDSERENTYNYETSHDNNFYHGGESLLDEIFSKAVEQERNLVSDETFYDEDFKKKKEKKKETNENFKKDFYEYLRNQSKYKF